MAIEGPVLDAANHEACAGFARNSSEISFGGKYITSLHGTTYYEARETGAALTRMNGISEREGNKVAALWSTTNAWPLAGLETMATYAAMQKEVGYVAPVESAPVQPIAPVATHAVTPVPLTAAAPVALAKRGDEVAWEDLPRYLDHDFEITTSRMGKRNVVLVAVRADENTVWGALRVEAASRTGCTGIGSSRRY